MRSIWRGFRVPATYSNLGRIDWLIHLFMIVRMIYLFIYLHLMRSGTLGKDAQQVDYGMLKNDLDATKHG